MIFYRNGLKLDKSYNGEISRVVNFPENEDEFKDYNYYFDRTQKTIVVIGIPKVILGADILSEFHRRYPGIYLQLFDDKQNNTLNVETKEK